MRNRPGEEQGVTGTLTTSCGVVHYRRLGSGQPIVFLHDFGTDQHSFASISSRLVHKHHIVSLDLLGHGKSEKRAPDLSIAAQGQAVLEVLRDLRLGGAVLVGHSLGGSVAIHVAAAAPQAVSKLVLLSAGCYAYRTSPRWHLLRFRLPWAALGIFSGPDRISKVRDSLSLNPRVQALTGEGPDPPSPSDAASWKALGRAYRQCTTHATLAEMEALVDHSLQHPTLVVWGSDNTLLLPASARLLFRDTRNVKFIEVAGAAHAVHEDQPETVTDLILDFLD